MQYLADIEYPILTRVGTNTEVSQILKLTRKRWWMLVAINIAFVLIGQTAAVLLGRFYYAEGGTSMFLATIVQTAGFPILCIPLILIPLPATSSPSPDPDLHTKKHVILIYLCLGVLLAGNNMLYAVGLLYLSASTYSLICASQLAFNAVLAYFINNQKFTPLILNSVVILSFSAALLAVNGDSDSPAGVSKLEYSISFLSTLGASAVYALLLSLMQLSFQKVLKSESFAVVMKMQIYTSLVATIVAIGGLFASGQWRTLHKEMESFTAGPPSYFMTLVWTAISWQVCSVGVVGLIFLVSSLFSNVISTLALTAAPIASLIVFRDAMDGAKVIAMLLALWGFASYLFQNYLDDSRSMDHPRHTETNSSSEIRTITGYPTWKNQTSILLHNTVLSRKNHAKLCVFAAAQDSGNWQRPPPGVDTRIHWENDDEGWVGGSASNAKQQLETDTDEQKNLLGEKFSDMLISSDSHYQFLGIAPDADIEEIKTAYRRLSKEYHPDTTSLPLKKASEKFMKLREIYNVLSDDESRRFYDWTLAQEAASRRAEKLRMKLEDPYEQDVMNYEPVPDLVDRLGGKNLQLSDQAMSALTFDALILVFSIGCIIYAIFFKEY